MIRLKLKGNHMGWLKRKLTQALIPPRRESSEMTHPYALFVCLTLTHLHFLLVYSQEHHCLGTHCKNRKEPEPYYN